MINATIEGSDLLNIAKSVPIGVSVVLTGSNTSNLPGNEFMYGMGIIVKRSESQIWIALFGHGHTNIAIDCYNGATWVGWHIANL